MNIKFVLILLLILISTPVFAHEHNEASYQHAWCKLYNGIEEYENKDFTRVDCLTKTNAVEFDFANKWAESIGQALHYEYMTGKKGMVVLIPSIQNSFNARYMRLIASFLSLPHTISFPIIES